MLEKIAEIVKSHTDMFDYYKPEKLRQSAYFVNWVKYEISGVAFDLDYEYTYEEEEKILDLIFA